MYIRQEDFKYLKNLVSTLSEAQEKRLMDLLKEAVYEKTGKEVERFKIVDGEDIAREMIEANEILTKTMLKRVYTTVKGEG